MTWSKFEILWGLAMLVPAVVFLWKRRPVPALIFAIGALYNVTLGMNHL